MKPLDWADEFDLGLYRHTIETVNSLLEKMGVERLYVRTNLGFMLSLCFPGRIGVHESQLAIKVDYPTTVLWAIKILTRAVGGTR